MGNDETATSSKPDKASSPVQEQPVVHPYPDWTAMQAYYGPGVPLPPSYFNTAVAPGHPPHPYMWGPQPLVPPFVTPYPAIYPHGVYSHHPMVSPSITNAPAKASNSKDRGLMKKLKGFDGLAVSIGNVNAEITVGDGSGQSSGENGAGGSSDASNEHNGSGGRENQRKRSSEDTPTSGESKAGVLANAVHGGVTNTTPDMSKGVVSPSTLTCKPTNCLSASTQTPWTQDERELKREKRKQSNRDSARRSRLRKQAETEELAMKVDNLGTENTTLKSEISRLKENSEKLRAENSLLLEKLNGQDNSLDKLESQAAPSIVVENFLSRIDENNRNNSNGGKLRQLFDSNPRTDAVAAG